MKLEVFSDMVCPWCYIGKRQLDIALATVNRPVEVVWRSFQLDPDYPSDVVWTLPEAHRLRYGISQVENDRRLALVSAIAAEVGLDYHLHQAVMANTFDAHRLVHHGNAHGKGAEVVEALMRAYAIEARWIGDPATLEDIASQVGLPPLPPDAYAAEVKADRVRARRYGITGVPTIVLNEERVLGAPTVEILTEVLRRA